MHLITLWALSVPAVHCGTPPPSGAVDCSFVDHACAKAFAAALDAGGKCFNHASKCPSDSSQCGKCQDGATCTTCTWTDNTKVFFPEGALKNVSSFTITGANGAQCYTVSGNLLKTGMVTFQFPTAGKFTETVTLTGVTIGCQDGTSVSASSDSLKQCTIPPEMKAADSTICCGTTGKCPSAL